MKRTYSPDQELRLLSLYQPWAGFVALGAKGNETRNWYTTYRGWVAIQAGRRQMGRDEVNLLLWLGRLHPPLMEDSYHRGMLHLLRRRYPTMKVVALVWLEDCRIMTDQAETLWLVRWLMAKRLEVPGWLLAVAVVGSTSCAVDIASQSELERLTGNWKMGRFAWKLTSVTPLAEPISVKGAQGLPRVQDAHLKAKLVALAF